MSYRETVRQFERSPEQLELSYQEAVKAGEAGAFAEAIENGLAANADNLLYAAWHYRLAHAALTVKKRAIAWLWALPLAALNGLWLWLLSDTPRFMLVATNPVTHLQDNLLPVLALLAAPISAALTVWFLTAAGKRRWLQAVAVTLGLAVVAAYPLLLFTRMWPRVFQQQYLELMVMHLALWAWAGVAYVALTRRGDQENRFAFLVKSLEAFVVGGLFAIAGGLFMAITFGLFNALNIELPQVVMRLFLAGGAGVIVLIAVALVYDPTIEPAQQSFDEGLSKLVALLTRMLLPLSILVLLVYLAFIPFNFREPFNNRNVLIIFNAMLFAVLALMMGATPVKEAELGERAQTWLRRGVMILAALALMVGLYALAAILYRTSVDRLTPNRLTFIGWNVINCGLLAWLLFRQWRAGRAAWRPVMHRIFAAGMTIYATWAIIGIVALPWFFQGNVQQVAHLSVSIQEIVYEQPEPILLKCAASPHIYLLQDGQKRWVKDIATFEALGYRWGDVRFVACQELRAVPDGQTIPADAGPPPQPFGSGSTSSPHGRT